MATDLNRKSKNYILELLNAKYHPPPTPRYIDLKKFKNQHQPAGDAIDTVEWTFVTPGYVGEKSTGDWVDLGSGGILNNDKFIEELLSNTNELEEAKLPTNGGRRRAQRKTKVKSKKRANKRRTRSRK